ncbi:hypothetical protein BASA81_002189 [Batrachochytrium salamandrivorans]|nr:hypothetical protein BASA81_002189 [Batrachochytrium salamandrivorans]
MLLVVVLVALLLEAQGQFELKPLPYDMDALEPGVDAGTISVHWGRHHRQYMDNMNSALTMLQGSGLVLRASAKTALDTKLEEDLEAVLTMASTGEEGEETIAPVLAKLRNNAGGYLNHNDYWDSLAPASKGGGVVDLKSTLDLAITQQFGSFDKFQTQFTREGMQVFGSGWVFLTYHDRKLQVETTENQQRPVGRVILACDLWEHAYYLKRHNKRLEYLAAYFSLVDMSRANHRYEQLLECEL